MKDGLESMAMGSYVLVKFHYSFLNLSVSVIVSRFGDEIVGSFSTYPERATSRVNYDFISSS